MAEGAKEMGGPCAVMAWQLMDRGKKTTRKVCASMMQCAPSGFAVRDGEGLGDGTGDELLDELLGFPENMCAVRHVRLIDLM